MKFPQEKKSTKNEFQKGIFYYKKKKTNKKLLIRKSDIDI